MSWKHAKFEDSTVFRSLEKIAQSNGLVKNDEIVKKATKSLDLSPSENLTDNIIKLCTGLRLQGMDKFADELESKFVVYKQAQTLYETSKETGEDLVDQAHPKGSHKLEGVEGDATIETIVDQHLKHLDVVNKKPKGKLASSRDIINAVKMAVGAIGDVDELYKEGAATMLSALQNAKKGVEQFNQIPNMGAHVATMAGLSAGLDPWIKFFTEYNPESGPVDTSDTGPWSKAKSAIDKLIAQMNYIDTDIRAFKNESDTVGFNEKGEKTDRKKGWWRRNEKGQPELQNRDPAHKEWWQSFDRTMATFKMALNLSFKGLHQLQGKQDKSSEVLKKPVYDILNSLNYYVRSVKTTFDEQDKTKLASLSQEDQTYIKTFGENLNTVLAKINAVAESFNPSGQYSYDPVSATYDLVYLPGEFKNTSLYEDFAGVNSLESLKSKTAAIKKDYLDTFNTYVKPIFDKADAAK